MLPVKSVGRNPIARQRGMFLCLSHRPFFRDSTAGEMAHQKKHSCSKPKIFPGFSVSASLISVQFYTCDGGIDGSDCIVLGRPFAIRVLDVFFFFFLKKVVNALSTFCKRQQMPIYKRQKLFRKFPVCKRSWTEFLLYKPHFPEIDPPHSVRK